MKITNFQTGTNGYLKLLIKRSFKGQRCEERVLKIGKEKKIKERKLKKESIRKEVKERK